MRLSRTEVNLNACYFFTTRSMVTLLSFTGSIGFIPVHGAAADFVNHILPGHHFTEDRVFLIPLRHRAGGDEELAASGIRFAGMAAASLPGRSKRSPERNSSRIRIPQESPA